MVAGVDPLEDTMEKEHSSSKFDDNAYVHAGSGDVKARPDQAGCNALPGGTVALSAQFIDSAAEASRAARGQDTEGDR